MPTGTPRDPQAEVRTRRALDGLSVIIRAFTDSGLIVITGGTYTLSETFVSILNGQLEDIEEDVAALEERFATSDELLAVIAYAFDRILFLERALGIEYKTADLAKIRPDEADLLSPATGVV